MTGQTIRWAMAFAATATLSGSIVLSAARSPEPVVVPTVEKRDPASVTDIELELILNKIREGDLLSQKSDVVGAKRAWDEARRMGEGLWPIHEGLGDSYARAKLTTDALREYQLAASLVPEKLAPMRSTIAAKRAATLSASGRPLEALRVYLDLNRPDLFGNRMLAIAIETADAVEMIERHAEVFDARLYSLAAAVHRKRDRQVEAAEAMGKFAVRVAPWDEAGNMRAVRALRETRRFDAAIDKGLYCLGYQTIDREGVGDDRQRARFLGVTLVGDDCVAERDVGVDADIHQLVQGLPGWVAGGMIRRETLGSIGAGDAD
ncbi:MAG: hypothetical protein EHM91_16130, partial [Planctomycetota bacterium]